MPFVPEALSKRFRRPLLSWGGFCLFFLLAGFPAQAARIGDISDNDILAQAVRFFSMRDPSVRYAVCGAVLLGVSCGLLGSFLVVRKMALVGDALSHAVLPGVALGFLWNMTKDPLAIFIGATLAGLIGTAVVSLIKSTTRLKEDTALGLVLASFFAIGTALIKMVGQLPQGNKSGLDKFMFGQAAALSREDVILMAIVTAITVLMVILFYKELLLTSFDAGFARASGFPVQVLHYSLMLFLAFAVVIALQAVGVVLVSAMLITPAASAYLLTDRLHRMLWISALFGLGSGLMGAFLSFLGNNLPTGPLMVLSATAIFVGAFLFGPRHGVIARWARQRSQVRRVHRENLLKAIYQILEHRQFQGEGVSLPELASRRHESEAEIRRAMPDLLRHELVTLDAGGNKIFTTPAGWQLACSIVRNHRLWELYLTHAANIAADHVHEDAEKIEHVLGEDVVRELEKRLNYANRDPHGKIIPSLGDLQNAAAPSVPVERLSGYGRPL